MVRVSWTEPQKGFFGGNYVDLTVGETPEAGCLQTGCGCFVLIIVAYCLISSLFYFLNNANNSPPVPAREQVAGSLTTMPLIEVLDSSYVNGMARLTISIENTSNQRYSLFFTPEDMEMTSLTAQPFGRWKLYGAGNLESDPVMYPPGEINRYNLFFEGSGIRNPGSVQLELQLTWRTETAEGKVPLSRSVYLNIFRR